MPEQTPDPLISGMNVAILVGEGFEQEELTGPRDALLEFGATARLLSTSAGDIESRRNGRPGDRFTVDMALEQADAEAFDAVLLPGGQAGAEALRGSADAQRFVKDMDAAGKPVAAIGHGTLLLAAAGIVAGRKLAASSRLGDDIARAGGACVDEGVVADANWLTGRGLQDLDAFKQQVRQLLRERRCDSGVTISDVIPSSVGEDG